MTTIKTAPLSNAPTPLSNVPPMPNVTAPEGLVMLKCPDGNVVLTCKVAYVSARIRDAVDTALGLTGTGVTKKGEENKTLAELPIPGKIGECVVTAAAVKRVFGWVDNPEALEEKKYEDYSLELFDALHVSNYLEVTPVFNALVDKTRLLIEGKTPAEIRKNLHIPDNVAPNYEELVSKYIKYDDSQE